MIHPLKEGPIKRAKSFGISQGEVIAYLAVVEQVRIELEQRLQELEKKAAKKGVGKRRAAS